ncbi:MAG: GFA family protein [Gammaproteobacteria bacterium]
MKTLLSGGCLCGAIRYEISSAPVRSVNCHCRTCQKWTGAPFLPLLFVTASALTVTGNYKEYATISAAGNTVFRAFCEKCGTPLFGRNNRYTELRPVAVTTLDDPAGFKPQIDMWISDAQPWDIMNPDLPKCSGNFW